MKENKKLITGYDVWLEWISTAILMVGILMTAYNVYPLGVWFSLVGNAGWLIVGYLWKKWSLIIIELMAVAIYISGLINHYQVF
jgi:hypothetical protein